MSSTRESTNPPRRAALPTALNSWNGPVTRYQLTRLPNGVTVATAEMPHMASVCLGFWAQVGGRHETAAQNGASHFLEHMLFKGTRRRTARAISEAVEGVGGYLNAYTAEEHTCYYARAHHRHFDTLFDVLADMYLGSVLDPVEVEKERAVIKEEVAMYRDQPREHVEELLNGLVWPEQPLGRPLTGTPRSLDLLKREGLSAFYREHYVSAGTMITAAGNISHERLVRVVQRLGRRFRPGSSRTPAPSDDRQDEPRLRLERRRTEQTALALGLRVCSRHDERRFALRLLNALLGENMSSRLFQLVREDHGLAYSIHSALDLFDDTGVLTISAALDSDHLDRCVKLVVAELRRFADQAPTVRELKQARDYLFGQHELSQENAENHMVWLGEHLLSYGRLPDEAAARRRLARVTPAEVREVARDFVRPDRLSLALVSPLKSAESARPLLRW